MRHKKQLIKYGENGIWNKRHHQIRDSFTLLSSMKLNPKIKGNAYSSSLKLFKNFISDYHWQNNVEIFQ